MKNIIVETSNVKRFLAALSALESRGASEACLMVIDGEPGLGKTTTLNHWIIQTGSIYLRAKKEWTATWFLNELLAALRIPEPRGIEKKFAKVIEALSAAHLAAQRERKPFGLVIDEADHVSNKALILETIRDISDMIEMPTILVGMGRVNDNLLRFPQVASRISQKVRFEKATKDDVQAMISHRCEVPVANDLVEFVHKVSGGYNREVLEAISNIERFGLRYVTGDDGVTLSDMAGQTIMNDRRSSQPIRIPEVL